MRFARVIRFLLPLFSTSLLLALSLQLSARAQQPASCTLPDACNSSRKLNPFCIDASLGPPAQSASYGHKDTVQVYLVNKNPFLYDYTIKTQSKDFSKEDGDALSAFSSLTGVGSSPTKAGQQPSGVQPSGGKPQASFYEQFLHSEYGIQTESESPEHRRVASACEQTLNNLVSVMNGVDDKLKSSETAISALASRMQGSVVTAASADLQNSGSSGVGLCRRAYSLRSSLSDFVNGQIESGPLAGAPLKDDFDSVSNALDALNGASSTYKSQVTSMLRCDPDNCEGRYQTAFKSVSGCQLDLDFQHALDERRAHDNHIKDIDQNIAQLTKKLQDLTTARCQLDATRSQLDRVVDDDSSFFQRIGPFGPYSDSEEVSLTISRSAKKQTAQSCDSSSDKNAQSKPGNSQTTNSDNPPKTGEPSTNSVVADVTFQFGGGERIYAAAGPVVSLVPVQEFQRATGVTTSRTPATVISFKTNSRTRIVPAMLFVHWRPLDKPWFFLSMGATAKSDNQKTSAEFLFGPTFGFLGNRVFFTSGGYVGQQQKLAANLQVGQAIPSSLTGDIPIQEAYHWNVGFSINFRLAGGGGSTSPKKTPTKVAPRQGSNP
jgi:hypothetical protein